MKIIIRGVRGSIPTSGPDTTTYGGNTSCVDITAEGWHLVLDAGTGIRNSTAFTNPDTRRVDILLTHLHFDHIQGLGFFKPLFDPGKEIHIWGPAGSNQSLQSRLSRYFSPPLFPVQIRDLPCKLTFHELDNSNTEIGPFRIQSRYVIHPGPTVGFRISHQEKIFTYLPDHEPALGLYGMPSNRKWISGIDLAMDADILLHDAQYTTEEYVDKKGWGHSSTDDALSFASIANVKRLLLAHHDPAHTDDMLNSILSTMQARRKTAFTYELAAEGMEIITG